MNDKNKKQTNKKKIKYDFVSDVFVNDGSMDGGRRSAVVF